jgi:hypothetical protein
MHHKQVFPYEAEQCADSEAQISLLRLTHLGCFLIG